jgi:hypothetical protein
MKTYFNFTLRGIELFRYYIILLAAMFAPYLFLFLNMSDYQDEKSLPWYLIVFIIIIFLATLLFIFFVTKLLIERVGYGEQTLSFKGTPAVFYQELFVGMLLSIVTLGIYIPWFLRRMTVYFGVNTTLNEDTFYFKGEASTLLLILIFSLLIPAFIIGMMTSIFFGDPLDTGQLAPGMFGIQLISAFLYIPYQYLINKWYVDFEYKGLAIKWHTDFWDAVGQIAMQILFTLLTAGIYGPMAFIRLYKYFVDKTKAIGSDRDLCFGYDIEPTRDFLLLWGELLLSIITLGIYVPWALAKVGKHLAKKTYTEEEISEEQLVNAELAYGDH